jgi:hypothetical protein
MWTRSRVASVSVDGGRRVRTVSDEEHCEHGTDYCAPFEMWCVVAIQFANFVVGCRCVRGQVTTRCVLRARLLDVVGAVRPRCADGSARPRAPCVQRANALIHSGLVNGEANDEGARGSRGPARIIDRESSPRHRAARASGRTSGPEVGAALPQHACSSARMLARSIRDGVS